MDNYANSSGEGKQRSWALLDEGVSYRGHAKEEATQVWEGPAHSFPVAPCHGGKAGPAISATSTHEPAWV